MSASPRCVTIESPARLHLGFVDLSGDLGRKFGSLGLAIEGLSTIVTATRSDGLSATGLESERTLKYARDIFAALHLDPCVALEVHSAIPAHAGLGSGTQLALAVASAIAAVCDLERSVPDLAALTGRGARSGIGIGVFATGGFVVDGGRARNTVVPPILARFDFPDDWRVILVQDEADEGLSGSAETAAFSSAPAMRPALAERLCRLTLMGVFPALAERDFATFAASITQIQEIIGDYFSPWQGGRFTSPDVAAAVGYLHDAHGLQGVGQTSWGPTGFAFAPSAAQAVAAINAAAARFADRPHLHFSVHEVRNVGASIERSIAANERSNATA
jgi:beta-RFAP synthase